MLARRLPSLLPDLAPDAALEATTVHSAAGLALPPGGLVVRPPLRAPHHGSSAVALVGGGTAYMRPGEISLASRGVLFLDELAEFPRSVLDALRQPLEEGVVRVCRARAAVAYPARFLLVGAMNPCPCGEGGPPGACRCSDATRVRYGRRISGPLLDRFDLRIEVTRPHPADLLAGTPGEASAAVAARVVAARRRAVERGVGCNAELSGRLLSQAGMLSTEAAALLESGLCSGALSARGLQRVRRVARTLADLAGREGGLPAAAWVVALAGLSGMGPARLGALLERWEPQQAWRRVEEGRVHLDARVVAGARRLGPELSARWRREAAAVDVAARWAAHIEAGVEVAVRDDPIFPAPLRDDHEPPAVLFSCGSLQVLRRPRVAVVGTRRCTYAGRVTARQLGRDLGAAGVCVISGLAHGIDAEAHLGALEARAGAPPAAVVGTGLDVVYPRRNAELWAAVAAAGCVLCEYPLTTRPAAWRFPARNRIIAALADVVVVVESHARGGSMHTVDAALERDRPVMAVPGPVRSPASTGTNDLLAAGSGARRRGRPGRTRPRRWRHHPGPSRPATGAQPVAELCPRRPRLGAGDHRDGGAASGEASACGGPGALAPRARRLAGALRCLVRAHRIPIMTANPNVGPSSRYLPCRKLASGGEKIMSKHKGGTVSFLLTVALTLVACGGADEPRLTKSQFVEQGSAICAETSARIESAAMTAFSEPGKIPTAEEVSNFASGTVAPAVEGEIKRLSELQPPGDDVERIDDVLQAGSDGVDTVRRDPTIILNTNNDGFGRYKELSSAYGLQRCGGESNVTKDALSGIQRGG